MSLQQELEITAVGNPESFDTFTRHLPMCWVLQALAATGKATVRRRRLPAEQVVWLVIGMGLMRDRSIEEIVAKLDLALPTPNGRSVAPSCIPEARQRLGEDPMERLFAETGSWWAHSHAGADEWRGLAVYAIDGSKLNVADTDVKRATFGGQSSAKGASDSAWPMIRIVALQAVRSHLIVAARFGPYWCDSRWRRSPRRPACRPRGSASLHRCTSSAMSGCGASSPNPAPSRGTYVT